MTEQRIVPAGELARDLAEEKAERRKIALAKVNELLDLVPSVRDSTEAVLRTMHRLRRKYPSDSHYCVNWADLSCVEAGVKVSSEGIRLFVDIEEASPGADLFCIEVARRLAKDYRLPDVEVSTEW